MDEIVTAIIGLLGVCIGASISYFLGLKQILIQNITENKAKLYLDLFNKLRDLNSSTSELNNLICNAQLFASDEIIDFLNKLDVNSGIKDNAVHELLVLIRKDLGLKKRSLTIYFHKMKKNQKK